MKTVYKYPIQDTTQQTVRLPKGAKLLQVASQGGQLQLWALVDTAQMPVDRKIAICGTGHMAPDGEYICTFQLMGWTLVFHVFDMGEVP